MFSEYDTCLEFGIDPALYFAKPRLDRALMCAAVLGKRAIHAMQDHDNAPKSKKKTKGKQS